MNLEKRITKKARETEVVQRSQIRSYVKVSYHQQIPIHYIGIKELIKNKESVGRFKDLDDMRFLRKAFKTMKNKSG